MVAQCVAPIQARVARLIKLDVCGNPVTGAQSAVVVTDGFVSINPSPQYLDGEEHQQRKANGELCVYQKDPSELTRVDITTLTQIASRLGRRGDDIKDIWQRTQQKLKAQARAKTQADRSS